MWWVVFFNVSVQGWIINPYENDFFYTSSKALGLPLYYTDIVNICLITFGVKKVINWVIGLEMFLESLSKCSCIFINILFIILHPGKCIYVYHSTCLCEDVPFLWATRWFLMVLLLLIRPLI